MANHLDKRGMVDIMGREFYWPHLAIDVYIIVGICRACACYGTYLYLKWKLQLLLARGSPEFVAFNVLGPFLRIVNGTQYEAFTTEKYLKLQKSIAWRQDVIVTCGWCSIWIQGSPLRQFCVNTNGKQAGVYESFVRNAVQSLFLFCSNGAPACAIDSFQLKRIVLRQLHKHHLTGIVSKVSSHNCRARW